MNTGDEIYTSSYRKYYIEDDYLDDQILAYVTHNEHGIRDVLLQMNTGYGDSYEKEVSADLRYSEAISEIHLSNELYQFFKDELLSNNLHYRLILNVYDRYDGTRLKDMIDQETYIVYYDALTQDTDQSSFAYMLKIIAYALIIITGLLVLVVLRVVF